MTPKEMAIKALQNLRGDDLERIERRIACDRACGKKPMPSDEAYYREKLRERIAIDDAIAWVQRQSD